MARTGVTREQVFATAAALQNPSVMAVRTHLGGGRYCIVFTRYCICDYVTSSPFPNFGDRWNEA